VVKLNATGGFVESLAEQDDKDRSGFGAKRTMA
jgi:hypothetical protein